MNYLLHHILVFVYVNALPKFSLFFFKNRDVFQGLNELESLDLEHNRLNYLDSEAFGPLQQLKHARLSHNFLSFVNEEGYLQGGLSYTDMIGNQSPFRHCFNLENLYLANNSIGQIFDDWRLNLLKLKVLDVGYNRIQHLTVSGFSVNSR